MTGGLMVAVDAFNGVRVFENTVRLVTMLVGMPIALLCIRFGLEALRRGEPDRAWGTLSYGLMLLVPAVGRAMNFGQPINWVTTGIYIAGLVSAVIGLCYRATLSGWWAALARWCARRRSRKDDDDPARR